MSWRNWIDEEWPKLAIWVVALAAGYLAWLCVTLLWESDFATHLGTAFAFVLVLSILRIWQLIWNRCTGDRRD